MSDEELQRYFDGDLAPAQARRVEEALARSEEDRRRLAALGEIRTLLREAAQRSAVEAPSEPMWAAIRAEVAKGQEPPLRERLAVRWRELCAGPARFVLPAAAAAAVALLWLLRPEEKEVPAAGGVVIEAYETTGVTATVFQIPGGSGGEGISVLFITPQPEGGEE
jgi:anti-sigma factor RsiW